MVISIVIGIIVVCFVVLHYFRHKRSADERQQTEVENANSLYDKAVNSMRESANANTLYDEAVNSMRESAMESEENIDMGMNTEEQTDTSALLFRILTNIGCLPQLHEDGVLVVEYQWAHFVVHFLDRFAHICEPWWSNIKSDDPILPCVRQAIDVTNNRFGATVFTTNPNEDGMIGIHSVWDVYLHPSMPEKEVYIMTVLNTFFEAKEAVREEFQRICYKGKMSDIDQN